MNGQMNGWMMDGCGWIDESFYLMVLVDKYTDRRYQEYNECKDDI